MTSGQVNLKNIPHQVRAAQALTLVENALFLTDESAGITEVVWTQRIS